MFIWYAVRLVYVID